MLFGRETLLSFNWGKGKFQDESFGEMFVYSVKKATLKAADTRNFQDAEFHFAFGMVCIVQNCP